MSTASSAPEYQQYPQDQKDQQHLQQPSQPVSHSLGAINHPHNTRVLLLGSGELGKEIAIAFMRLGAWVAAADSYEHAPAAQVAHEHYVLSMSDESALQALIAQVNPTIIVPEVEAIATQTLAQYAAQGVQIAPSATVTSMCMDRAALRCFAAQTLGLATTEYRIVHDYASFEQTVAQIGTPCVVKPNMSSSGHGQSVISKPAPTAADLQSAWNEAITGARAASAHMSVIVEAFAPIDYEITMLVVSSSSGIVTCEPIVQEQEHGDYRTSVQPAHMNDSTLRQARNIAQHIVEGFVAHAQEHGELGWGVFGVELFVLTDGQVLFNEVSARPHDTGMVTMISQRFSEFDLHARALLGIGIDSSYTRLLTNEHTRVFASRAMVVAGHGSVRFNHIEHALVNADYDLRIFCKPTVNGTRRMAVALAGGSSERQALERTEHIVHSLAVSIE